MKHLKRNSSKNLYGSEEIFIVPYHNLQHINNGFTRVLKTKNIWSQFDKVGKFVYRNECEGINLFQQIIPYILVTNSKGEYLVGTYRDKEDESLKKQFIGHSSHIKKEDVLKSRDILFDGTFNALLDNFLVNIVNSPIKFIGYIRDMKDESYNDHLGCVSMISILDERDIGIRKSFNETNITYEYMSVDKLVEMYGNMESWSKHIINYMVDSKIQ